MGQEVWDLGPVYFSGIWYSCAGIIIIIFCTHFSAGITRMETRSTCFFLLSTVLFTLKKNAKLLGRGSLFQALVEVSGLIFMDVRSPLGIVTTLR